MRVAGMVVAAAAICAACTTVPGDPIPAAPPTGTVSTLPPSTATVPAHPLVMPDLAGLFWTDAEHELRRLGWTGVLVKGADVTGGPGSSGAVAAQAPPAGAVIDADAPITVSFHN